ncbi:MAG: hypothetical protein MUE85_08075 [Microscillaceae bacterium]|jgi:hypothetical protein|nr:hypothetical protein [Microscillaceae bacterium]
MKIKTGYKIDEEGNVYLPLNTLLFRVGIILVISIFFGSLNKLLTKNTEKELSKYA